MAKLGFELATPESVVGELLQLLYGTLCVSVCAYVCMHRCMHVCMCVCTLITK